MLRKVITPTQQNISINLPREFVGKTVGVIAFTIDDPSEESIVQESVLTHFASEKTLSKDWLTTEEDNAWKAL